MLPRSDNGKGLLRDIRVPRIYRTLALSEYAEGLPSIKVWVNPPRALLGEFDTLQSVVLKDAITVRRRHRRLADRIRGLWHRKVALPRATQAIVAWYARLWSPDGVEEFDEQEVVEFADRLWSEDPELWSYMTIGTWQLIKHHRGDAKKNWETASSR